MAEDVRAVRPVRRGGPTRWDYAMAALAGFCVVGGIFGIGSALWLVASERSLEGLGAAAFGAVTSAAWGWWIGVGSWRSTYWARRRRAELAGRG